MNPSEQDRLLREVLADEALEQRRAASLEGMLGAVRLRKRRRALATSVLATLTVALTIALVAQRRLDAPRDRTIAPSPRPAVARISDDQLLALFADRSVALIGQPGQQQLVFLDAEKR
ncbi:MAG TPA: hypothetical protein VM029_22535 [Opitutaceae bacterium]|nr:hypothetical protein [Opitutaceae bacterium]